MGSLTAHAKLSPSSAERWMTCPGSVRLAEQSTFDLSDDSPWAREGTQAHELAYLKASLHFGLMTKAKYEEKVRHWSDIVPSEYHEDMHRHADSYVELLQRLYEEHGHTQVMLEQKVDPGIPGCWGTADAILISPTSIQVVDYKYGRGVVVKASENPQLMIYGLGALEMVDGLIGDVETVCVSVHQPRLGDISHYCIDAVELRQWRDQVVIPMAKLALSSEAYLSPSEGACRFCPVAGQCRERAEYMTRRDFGHPGLLSVDELAEMLEVVPDIIKWCTQVQETALHRAYNDGEEIPGWKVVKSGGRRSITDPAKALEALVNAGFDLAEVSRPGIQTLGKLERIVKGKKELDRILGDLIQKGEGKESLVPEGDDRQPITGLLDAQADFSE